MSFEIILENVSGTREASGTFANYTHIFVSFLKAWMVTVQGIDCYNAAFYCHFKKAHTRNRSFKKKNFFSPNSARKLVNWIIVDMNQISED